MEKDTETGTETEIGVWKKTGIETEMMPGTEEGKGTTSRSGSKGEGTLLKQFNQTNCFRNSY